MLKEKVPVPGKLPDQNPMIEIVKCDFLIVIVELKVFSAQVVSADNAGRYLEPSNTQLPDLEKNSRNLKLIDRNQN